VIEGGVTTLEGRASELISDPRIIDAYLGAVMASTRPAQLR
jgi:branched-chain amino acid transport system ATP-binding protein